MFHVRTIHPEDRRVEVAGFDLVPGLAQGQTVCNLFAGFLAERRGEFRERLPFLNKGDIELQWAAEAGGAAFASFFSGGRAVGMGVLLSGVDPEADAQMLEAFRLSIAGPMLGEFAMEAAERPLVVMIQPGDQPELIPTIQLLVTALASVYFRAIRAMAGASQQ
jgi:hypothetical protein